MLAYPLKDRKIKIYLKKKLDPDGHYTYYTFIYYVNQNYKP